MQSANTVTRLNILLATAICCAALALRVTVAMDPFWLDEIWSYYLTYTIESPWEVLSKLRIDNNHPLNTLTIYLLGDQANWSLYRAPSLVAGVATVALLAPAARLLGSRAWPVMLLGAVSLPLIQYSAEARGYSMAAFCGLATWWIYYAKLTNRPAALWRTLFWGVCILGLLSHLTYVFVLLALGLARAIELAIDEESRVSRLRTDVLNLAVPFAFLIWIYLYFYGRTSAGGAEGNVNVLTNLVDLGRLSIGMPNVGQLTTAAALCSLALIVFGITRLQAPQKLFFGLVTLLIPGLLLTIYQPDFFYPRYLLVCLPFAYLLLARAFDWIANQSRGGKIAAICLLVLSISSSLYQYRALARDGKGDYPGAINDLYAAAGSASFSVGSDFDFRNKALLDFYLRYRNDADQLIYIERAWEQTEAPDFFLMHDQLQNHIAKTEVQLANGNYTLIKQYPYAGLSGWNWYLYRHTPDLGERADKTD